jgi:hypothetical protein
MVAKKSDGTCTKTDGMGRKVVKSSVTGRCRLARSASPKRRKNGSPRKSPKKGMNRMPRGYKLNEALMNSNYGRPLMPMPMLNAPAVPMAGNMGRPLTAAELAGRRAMGL